MQAGPLISSARFRPRQLHLTGADLHALQGLCTSLQPALAQLARTAHTLVPWRCALTSRAGCSPCGSGVLSYSQIEVRCSPSAKPGVSDHQLTCCSSRIATGHPRRMLAVSGRCSAPHSIRAALSIRCLRSGCLSFSTRRSAHGD